MKTNHSKSAIPVGVIGAGSFGITVAHLLSVSNDVLLYARDPDVVQRINEEHHMFGVNLSPRICAVSSPFALAEQCDDFPGHPSDDFRDMMHLVHCFLPGTF
jgi:glycerol-3-phosphate dehydrogenase (NAD(P)+)